VHYGVAKSFLIMSPFNFIYSSVSNLALLLQWSVNATKYEDDEDDPFLYINKINIV